MNIKYFRDFEVEKLPVVYPSNREQANIQFLESLLIEDKENLFCQLATHGAILLRGFNCSTISEFYNLIHSCQLGPIQDTSDYRIPRTVLDNGIYTSSDLPVHIRIPLHHEKPRSLDPPTHIYFFCQQTSLSGGETVFADAAKIWKNLPLYLQDKIQCKQVLYTRYLFKDLKKANKLNKVFNSQSFSTIKQFFKSDNEALIKTKLANMSDEFFWLNCGDLILQLTLPGMRQHPMTHEPLWFNSSHYQNFYSNVVYSEVSALSLLQNYYRLYLMLKNRFPLICHYGDGKAFSKKDIQHILKAVAVSVFEIKWQPGDFMIVDNYRLMHGKNPHKGQRKLYSCMTRIMT